MFYLTPGPVNIPPSVLRAMCRSTHHRDPQFIKSYQYCRTALARFFQNDTPSYLFLFSGTGAMEASLLNCCSPGDKVIILTSGRFGKRFAEIAKRFHLTSVLVESPYGTVPSPDALKKSLKEHPDAKAVTACHNETSTGVVAPIADYAKIVAESAAIFIVDTVSSSGSIPINQAQNNIDICLGASQKGFMLPPGCAFLSFHGEKYQSALKNSKLSKYYMEILPQMKEQDAVMADFTPPTHCILGLEEALRLMLEEGIENGYKRRREVARYVRERGKELGFELLVQKGEIPSDSVTALVTEKRCSPQALCSKLLSKDIMMMTGIADLSDKIIRISNLGSTTMEEMIWAMDEIESTLKTL